MKRKRKRSYNFYFAIFFLLQFNCSNILTHFSLCSFCVLFFFLIDNDDKDNDEDAEKDKETEIIKMISTASFSVVTVVVLITRPQQELILMLRENST